MASVADRPRPHRHPRPPCRRSRTPVGAGQRAGRREPFPFEAVSQLSIRTLHDGLRLRSGRIVERARAFRRASASATPPGIVRDFDTLLHDAYLWEEPAMRLGITGHRGLPPEVEAQVRTELAKLVDACHGEDLVGISCIADGSDAWFAQAVLAHGGRLEAVIPATEYRDSAGLAPACTELMARAVDVHHTGMRESTSQAHQAGSGIVVGLADKLIAVWDSQPARGYGGTADVVAYARSVGMGRTRCWRI